MKFLDEKETKISNDFINKGYIIGKIKNKVSLNYIRDLTIKNLKKILNTKKNINLNKLHKLIPINELNSKRVKLIYLNNKDKNFRFHYFNIAKEFIYLLAGNELMMQKNINISLQFPDDNSSLLPVHSDVWSGDSPYEINLWLPLVNCFKTKSMYILEEKHNKKFVEIIRKKKVSSSNEIFKIIKKDIRWLNVKYGEFLLFNQSLPHGNVVNIEKETRVSMNCRFKTLFSPYGDKKIGEFFLPITTRAMTNIAMNFEFPFNKS